MTNLWGGGRHGSYIWDGMSLATHDKPPIWPITVTMLPDTPCCQHGSKVAVLTSPHVKVWSLFVAWIDKHGTWRSKACVTQALRIPSIQKPRRWYEYCQNNAKQASLKSIVVSTGQRLSLLPKVSHGPGCDTLLEFESLLSTATSIYPLVPNCVCIELTTI